MLRSIATGTAALAGLSAAGTATADHIQPGECARITHDVQSYTSCSGDTYGPIIEAGTEGTIMSTCDANSLVYFVPEGFDQDDGWVDDSFLEKC